MINPKVEPQGYKDSYHPTPIQIHLCQHERKFLRCSATDLAPSQTGSTFCPSVVGFDAKLHQRIIVKEVGILFMRKNLSGRFSSQPAMPQKVTPHD